MANVVLDVPTTPAAWIRRVTADQSRITMRLASGGWAIAEVDGGPIGDIRFTVGALYYTTDPTDDERSFFEQAVTWMMTRPAPTEET